MARTQQTARMPAGYGRISRKNVLVEQPLDHTLLPDNELFNIPYELYTNDVFVRLAKNYSNKAMWERLNAAQPNAVKIIHSLAARVKNAIRATAQISWLAEQATLAQNEESRMNDDASQQEDVGAGMDTAHLHVNESTLDPMPSVRFPEALAPKLSTHVLFIFVGPHREATAVYTALFPVKTRAILEERAQQNMIEQQPIYLIDDTPEIFETYRLYLYTGRIFTNNA